MTYYNSWLIKLFFLTKWWIRSNHFVLLQLFFMIFLQFKGMKFISCIQEKYKLSARLNFAFNPFHDLKFPEPSSKLSRKLTFLSAKDCRKTGFIKSTNYRPTDPPTTDPIIIFKRLGNRNIFILQNIHAAEKIIPVYYLLDE